MGLSALHARRQSKFGDRRLRKVDLTTEIPDETSDPFRIAIFVSNLDCKPSLTGIETSFRPIDR
jgi:hypothetical protein